LVNINTLEPEHLAHIILNQLWVSALQTTDSKIKYI